MLERISIKTLCTASWDDMVGSESARFCCTCSKTVYDLSAMDAVDAEAFLEQHHGEDTCARLYRRADGRILTSECGPGARKRHAQRAAKVLTATLAVTTLLVAAADRVTQPTLNVDDTEAEDIARDSVVSMSMGGLFWAPDESDEETRAILRQRFDEEQAISAEEAEPESEVLGTSARTARVATARRTRGDAVIAGVVRLVSPPRL